MRDTILVSIDGGPLRERRAPETPIAEYAKRMSLATRDPGTGFSVHKNYRIVKQSRRANEAPSYWLETIKKGGGKCDPLNSK